MRNKNRFLAVWLSAAMAMSMSTPVLASETAEPAVNGSSLETQKPEEAAEENSRKSVYEAYLDGSEEYRQQPLPSLHELKEQEIMESSYRE